MSVMTLRPLVLVLPLLLGLAQRPAGAQEAPVAVSVERAKEVEAEVEALADRCSPAFVVVSGGSGVIISDDGFVLTNHHVVASRAIGDRWWVRRASGERLRAKLIGWDPRGDIALIKLDAKHPLPFLPLGDSDRLRIGDMAIALGNPYGFATRDAEPTVTLGIVSAIHAYRQNYNDAIQTDAAINPGNSGGPLLNLRGEVVGINGRVAVRFGNRMNTGVGYAIPSNQIRRFLPKLKEGGTVAHGAIRGLILRDTDDGGEGAIVDRVTPSSPADDAGFQRGDLVIRLDGREVRSPSAFYGALGCYPAGETVTAIVRRAGAEAALSATLVAIGESGDTPPAERPFLGARLGAAPEESEGKDGVEVVEVIPAGPADKAGLRTHDVLLRVDGTAITSPDDLSRLLLQKHPGQKLELEVRRGTSELGLEVELGKTP